MDYPAKLPADGERYLTEYKGTIELEHLHRYQLARSIAKGLDVLDIACGEGYGSDIIASSAKSVVGVDINPLAVDHASFHYRNPRIVFRVGSATDIPIQDASIDLVVSFETIEHLEDHQCMMQEIRRVLRPGGVLIISSPNKLEYSDKPGYSNPFHVKELYTEEFVELVAQHFKNTSHFAQRLSAVSLIANDQSAPFLTFSGDGSSRGVPNARYDVIISSDNTLPLLPNSAYEILGSPLEPYAAELSNLKNEEDKRTINQLALQNEEDKRTIDQLALHLIDAVTQANEVLHSKWWRATHTLRRLSNSLRKRRGRPTKTWPTKLIVQQNLIEHCLARDTELPAQESDFQTNSTELVDQPNAIEIALNEQLAVPKMQGFESDAMAQQSKRLAKELADARQKPGKSFRQKYKSKTLYFLAKQTALFTQRRRVKFLHSARKRDPKRSLQGFGLGSNASVDFVMSSKPAARTERSHAQLKKDAKTVMVVSHDASRTGAPILALNLVREFSKRYNVVSVLLGGGELRNDFDANSLDILHLDQSLLADSEISERVAAFSNKYEVSQAFVNSVESRDALPGLKRAGVTSVALLHEFASFTHPETAFSEVLTNADQVVFSTKLTLANATSERGYEHPTNVHVLPQGKCEVPKKSGSREEQEDERLWLDSILRPHGDEDREFVIVGAGTIEIRKGIDLFIETATRVIESSGGSRFRFIWIGEAYGQFNENLRSVHLADQINRAGVQTQVQIVRSTSEIEHAYSLADLMLLPSRLDPLPNVAIDMLLVGKPVVCFDRATGIADFLDDCGLKEACVASYMNTAEMAKKILALADSSEFMAEVAAKGSAHAHETFDFPAYVNRLDSIANSSRAKSDHINEDAQYIISSGAFRSDFYQAEAKTRTAQETLIRKYLVANQNGPYFKKPEAGFNQMIYAEDNGWIGPEDPFVQFLKADRPNGRWSLQVIDESSPINPEALADARVALHIHVYFVEEFRDMLERLKVNKFRPSLFVSAPEHKLDVVHRILEDYNGPVVQVQAVQNRGRDIAPLLTVFGPELVESFDIIGHLHTKRSLHVTDRDTVQRWTTFLMENTVGGTLGGATLDRIVTAMWSTPELGIVYPDDPGIVGWTKNRRQAEVIAARMGIHSLPEKIDFPVGTMFWARSAVLKRFVDMNLSWDDYPPEPLPIDGSLLHAIERLFGVVPGLVGLRSGVTNVRGLTR